MIFKPSDLIALGALILSFSVTCGGIFVWYIQGEKKKFAAERDFQHIKNNQKGIADGIAYLTKEIEDKLEMISKDTKLHLEQISRDILEINITLGIKNRKE